YPNGFKATVTITGSLADQFSMLKDQWAKAGVDLQLKVMEGGAYSAAGNAMNHELYPGTSGSLSGNAGTWMLYFELPFMQYNHARVNDPGINKFYQDVSDNFWNQEKRYQLVREIQPYWIEQSWYITMAGSKIGGYTIWQPWIKKYNGESQIGGYIHGTDFQPYIWLDQDLKEKMTGKR
ncbi:MAG: hypothetical protein HYX83_02430, partial [Chloroflexi bacterium]|nr:hypothetical protein [Chloroflexota bacterium]